MIRTDDFSAHLRAKAVRLQSRELLVSTFSGSDQEADLTDPPNCGGVGRVRHFRRSTNVGWPSNPLPIDPACAFLGCQPTEMIKAEVFQNAVCNGRCWYCFVPFNMLAGRESQSAWVSAPQLVDQYMALVDRPPMIDLSGGQPDLVPEWVPWMMAALKAAGVADSVYLWSDDNLSNDYFFRFLSEDTRREVAEYRGYGRVCCFKGFDEASFAFNTRAAPDLFDRQFTVFSRLLEAGLDLYCYATFTGPVATRIPESITAFVDRLQRISEALPLRLVPLEIEEYGPVTPRLRSAHLLSLDVQRRAVEAWTLELDRRFSATERALSIVDVPIRDLR